MKTTTIAVLCMLLGVVPAWSYELGPSEMVQQGIAVPSSGPTLDQSEDFLGPDAEPVMPSRDVPLYVPLTAEQEELPTWTKPITDRVPATE
jgi:hypothetical protein